MILESLRIVGGGVARRRARVCAVDPHIVPGLIISSLMILPKSAADLDPSSASMGRAAMGIERLVMASHCLMSRGSNSSGRSNRCFRQPPQLHRWHHYRSPHRWRSVLLSVAEQSQSFIMLVGLHFGRSPKAKFFNCVQMSGALLIVIHICSSDAANALDALFGVGSRSLVARLVVGSVVQWRWFAPLEETGMRIRQIIHGLHADTQMVLCARGI